MLAALGGVEAVVLSRYDTPLALITGLLPHILVKGADWPEDAIVGGQEVKVNGGQVVRIPFTTETTITGIFMNIRD